jgi:uncharacterized protein (TIGR02996 family)
MDVREAELLAAIRADPEDDAPRLVYADYLMQRGDPRGEYIALACNYATYDQAVAMFERHKATWLAVLPPELRGVRMRHGLVDQLVYDGSVAELFAPERVAAVLALAPVPDVWLPPDQVHVFFRVDGRVAAQIQIRPPRAPEGVQRIDIVELPSLRVLATAANPTHTMAEHHDYTHGLAVGVRFAADRDVLRYELRDGPTDHYVFSKRELAFEIA